MTPGYKTTEFWLCVIHKVFALILTSGFLTQATALKWESLTTGAATIVLAVLASYGVVTTYTAARTDLKAAALKSDPQGLKGVLP
jgi:uncharacterized membrane protein (Fun14 family)